LCSQVDKLLAALSSNLDALKYSIDFRRIGALRQSLNQFGKMDQIILEAYDEFTSQLGKIATQIKDISFDPQERVRYARHLIEDFEAELRSAQADMHDAKARAVGAM
jgi:hypothetical protein